MPKPKSTQLNFCLLDDEIMSFTARTLNSNGSISSPVRPDPGLRRARYAHIPCETQNSDLIVKFIALRD